MVRKDAPEGMRFVIPILEEDIRLGVCIDPANCAFAVAMRRVVGPNTKGGVFFRDYCYIDMGNGEVWRWRYTNAIRKLIRSFDSLDGACDVVAPGIYTVVAPTKSQTLAVKNQQNRDRRSGKTRAVRSRAGRPVRTHTIRGSRADVERRAASSFA